MTQNNTSGLSDKMSFKAHDLSTFIIPFSLTKVSAIVVAASTPPFIVYTTACSCTSYYAAKESDSSPLSPPHAHA